MLYWIKKYRVLNSTENHDFEVFISFFFVILSWEMERKKLDSEAEPLNNNNVCMPT